MTWYNNYPPGFTLLPEEVDGPEEITLIITKTIRKTIVFDPKERGADRDGAIEDALAIDDEEWAKVKIDWEEE